MKNDNIDKFVNHVKSHCKEKKVAFKEYKRPYVKLSSNIKCGGYFDGDGVKPTLAYAKGHVQSLELLAHEYCHMTQWIDRIPLWDKGGIGYVEPWLKGKDVENIDEHINNARDLELDNEIRTVEMIKKWDLPIDIDLYVKKSNAYILFYNYLKVSRKWSSPSNSPYGNKNILDAMSTKFDMNYNELAPEILQLFIDEKI